VLFRSIAGEKLKSFIPQKYTVYNGYGPTEYTVETSFFTIDKYYENIPIGKPACNTSVYITDSFENLQPVGVPGELCISGKGLSRGYLNQKELTEKKFVANPFKPGERMYKTGDLARWLPDGNLEFLGRIDRQVKIRGFRIELGEIEQAIKSFESIKDAVVVDHIDENNRLYLCGYYISDEEIDTDKLKRDLTKNLPDYMIPRHILKIDKVPLTPHGKVDKKALPVPDKSLLSSGYVAPVTEEERFLSKIWEDILKCGSVGINDNFFSLGGDSIMAIQAVARAREAGINISAGQLQAYPTISELLSLENVLSLKKKEEDKLLTGELPLIPIEEWFFELEFERLNHFNQAFLFVMKEEGKIEIIEKTLNILQHHHDGLRLRFRKEQGKQGNKWIQRYEEPEKTSVSVEIVDISSVPENGLSIYITKKCTSLQSSLDITEGPVLRSVLFKGHKDGKDRLFIVIHHLCIDMVSWRIILGDFHSIYKKLSRGETPSLPGKSSSYRDWSESLRKYIPAAEKHGDYWLTVFKDSVPLPVQYKESKYSDVRDYKISLDSHDTELLLNTVPSAYNTQINDILLSALLLAFHRSFNVSDLMIDLEGHGREENIGDVDLSSTVGWFTTIFPVHLKSPSMTDYGSIIKSVKEILRAIPDKGLSYGVLRYLSERKDELKKLEGRRVAFNYLGQLDSSIMEGELLCGAEESPGSFVSPENSLINLLDINGFVAGGSLSMIFGYSSNIWEKETLEKLAGNFTETLKEIIYHCIKPGKKHLTPSDFPLAPLSQSFLDGISDPSSIESIYGLSPLQEGLLFHALAAPDSDQYCTQLSWNYNGELNIDALKDAWQCIFSSYPIFRTGFVWEGGEIGRAHV